MSRVPAIAWRAALAWLAGCVADVQVLELADSGVEPRDAGADTSAPEDAALATGTARVVAAFEQTCVVDDSGLYCWGLNADGQVGVGSREMIAVGRPARIDTTAEDVEVCAGQFHTCALQRGGALECWGANAKGQLGLGDFDARAAPTAVAGTLRFASVACGGEITCGVSDDGELYCWGANNEGALGQGEGGGVGVVSAMPLPVPLAGPVRQVSVGQGHVCAILESGALYCWGRDGDFQLGVPPPPPGIEQVPTPAEVVGGGRWLQVSAGQRHTCAVRMDRRLFCWGTDGDFDGRLGMGTTRFEVLEATQVGDGDDYVEVHASWFHTCALRAQGQLYCWGRNDEGQLAHDDLADRYEPELVEAGGQAWQAFALGPFHTCGLRAGAAYCWGKNDRFYQQLGLGDTMRRYVPTLVPIP